VTRILVVRRKASGVSALCDLPGGSDLLQGVNPLSILVQSILIEVLVLARKKASSPQAVAVEGIMPAVLKDAVWVHTIRCILSELLAHCDRDT
jgi:hypothetical protein